MPNHKGFSNSNFNCGWRKTNSNFPQLGFLSQGARLKLCSDSRFNFSVLGALWLKPLFKAICKAPQKKALSKKGLRPFWHAQGPPGKFSPQFPKGPQAKRVSKFFQGQARAKRKKRVSPFKLKGGVWG